MSEQKIAVVTGTSSGIGLETAIHLAKNGFKTYATMRNLNKAEAIKQRGQSENLSIEILELDVNDDTSVKNAINTIVEKEGRIDVLVNNAGYALLGAVEDLSTQEINDQFNTNVLGPYRTVREVLPTMRKQNSGRIITISSIAGFMGMGAGSAYAASKFAVRAITDSLRVEVKSFGVKAILVSPGPTDSKIWQKGKAYKNEMRKSVKPEIAEHYKTFAKFT